MISMYTIRQESDRTCISDPYTVTLQQLNTSSLTVRKGMRIGVAVGSRGIHAIDAVCRAVVEYIKEQGADPFIIPAMGSHGGATAEGQRAVLAGYGITEASIGVPVEASMEIVELDAPGCECRLFVSRPAMAADGVIVITRVKPHTDFHGRYESGLVKMAVIGLGKHAQALEIHKFGVRGLRELLPVAAAKVFATGKILGGVAIVENRYDRPVRIEVLSGEMIMEEEPRLLQLAAEHMPHLPVDKIDTLIVDFIGKDFSGTGLDTNIIGRMRIRGVPEPASPSIGSIYVRDLSERSHGNALGIGLADVISRRLFDRIQFAPMYENAFTSTFLERVKIPVIADTDRQALSFTLRSCGYIDPGAERVIRIRTTLHLDEMQVSDAVLREVESQHQFSVVNGPFPLLNGDDVCEF
jgi:hypothetical protein